MKDVSLSRGGYSVEPRSSTPSAPPDDLLSRAVVPHALSGSRMLHLHPADAPCPARPQPLPPEPLGPAALVPAVRTLRPLPLDIRWEEATTSIRSHAGLNAGVHFLRLRTEDIVAKLPQHPEREAAAAWTARAVGLNVPETRLEERPPPTLGACLPASSNARILVMQRIPGHHFGELQPADFRDLRLANPRGRQLFEQLGRVLAYDYLIGNPDRFPAPGLGGNNTGNVMLCDSTVWCIDSTLPAPADVANEDWMSPFRRGQSLLFKLAREPNSDAGSMERVAGFFADVPQVNWADFHPSLLLGAAEQCRVIARTDNAHFLDALATLRSSPGGPRLARFILDNLGRFREAFGT